MKTVLLWLLITIPTLVLAQSSVPPIDSSRTTFTIYLKDGGQYVGRIIARDSIKLVVRRQGGGLSYLAPSDVTRIEPYQRQVQVRGRELYNITMNDGTIYTGQIRERDSVRVILRRRGGESILSPKEIVRIEPVVSEAPSPSGSRPDTLTAGQDNQFPWLLYNQTGFALRRGQLAYRNIGILYNELSYGLLSFLTVRASVMPSFYGDAFFNSTIYTRPQLGAKLSIPLGPVRLGGELSYRWSERVYYGYGYSPGPLNRRDRTLIGFIAFGSLRSNLTLAYSNQKIGNRITRVEAMMVGFTAPIGHRLSLVSDNRFLVGKNSYDYDNFSQVSGALRLNRPRHAFDLGLLVGIRDEDKLRFYPLPYAAFNMRLSRR